MEEHFSLRWNNFHKNMSAGFQSLLLEDSLVDVTLAAGGKFLQAHRLVLSVCSPYFKQLFAVNPCKHPIVILKDVQYKLLADMLNFMYRGEVNVCQDDLADFLKTAELLQIRGLADQGSGSNKEGSSLEQGTSGEHDRLPLDSNTDQKNTSFEQDSVSAQQDSVSAQQDSTLNQNSRRQISGQNSEQVPASHLPHKRSRPDTQSPATQNIAPTNETPAIINLVPKEEPPDVATAHTTDIEDLNLLESYHGEEPGQQTDLVIEEPLRDPVPAQSNYNVVQHNSNVTNMSQEDSSFQGSTDSAAPASSGMITRHKALMSSNNGLRMNLRRRISTLDWIVESLEAPDKYFGMTIGEIKKCVLNRHKVRETSVEKAVKLGIACGYLKQATVSGSSGKIVLASKSKKSLCSNFTTLCNSSANHQRHSEPRQNAQKGGASHTSQGKKSGIKRPGEVVRRRAEASRMKSPSTSNGMQVLLAAKKIKKATASRLQRLNGSRRNVEHTSLVGSAQEFSSESSKIHSKGSNNKDNRLKKSQVIYKRKTL